MSRLEISSLRSEHKSCQGSQMKIYEPQYKLSDFFENTVVSLSVNELCTTDWQPELTAAATDQAKQLVLFALLHIVYTGLAEPLKE